MIVPACTFAAIAGGTRLRSVAVGTPKVRNDAAAAADAEMMPPDNAISDPLTFKQLRKARSRLRAVSKPTLASK